MKRLALAALAWAVMLALAAPAHAATTQTFSTSQSEVDPGVRNQGWWSATVANNTSNDNYIAENEQRDFFSFDLSSACPASSVTLQLTRFDQTDPVTYSLFDVSTPAATLNANDGVSQTIFDDLGTGTSFGSFSVTTGAPEDVLSFPLNADGVAAFNAARGGFFSIGGSTPSTAPGYIYGFSGGSSGTQQVSVTCLPTTKEECKNGGWRNFPDFKNQGDCISFVATGGKKLPAG
jgi:hypothetical protein